MLIVTGVFENERFIPDKPVSIPQKKRVRVTIEEDINAVTKHVNKWREIGEAIINCDEELLGQPQPIQFRTIVEGVMLHLPDKKILENKLRELAENEN